MQQERTHTRLSVPSFRFRALRRVLNGEYTVPSSDGMLHFIQKFGSSFLR